MIGRTLLHYRILEKIGQGGMGVVYRARDLHLDRFVAVKVLPPEKVSDAERRRRFILEAKAASALHHPGIVVIHDIDECEGAYFIAMEYVAGQTLHQAMRSRRIPLAQSLHYTMQIADALAAAHAAGVVHRDIKPSNVMVSDGDSIKILDFGLAKLTGAGGPPGTWEEITRSLGPDSDDGAIRGTLAYMSPEQARGHELDHRTDIFSLGIVLYHLVTGQLPFQGPSAASTLEQILFAPIPSLRTACPQVPEALEETVARATAKNPEARFRDMTEMAHALRSLERETETVTVSEAALRLKKPGIPRRRILAAVATLVLLILAVVAFRGHFRSPAREGAVPSRIRLAVLPLANIGGHAEIQEIIDGLVEMLAAKFAQAAQFRKDLSVISPADIRSEKVVSAAQARQVFGVNLALTGSVQRHGNLLKIFFGFVDTSSRRQISAAIFEANAFDMTAVDEEIFNQAAAMLHLDLGPETKWLLHAGKTTVNDAYAFFLPAQGYLSRHDIPENLDRAIDLFQKALREDPGYALAYAGLGEAYYWKFKYSGDPSWAERALAGCTQAQKIQSRLARVSVTRGMVYTGLDQPEQAVRELSEAIAIEPGNPEAHRELGRAYEKLGKTAQAEGVFREAIALQPDSWTCHWQLGVFFYQHVRYEESARQFLEVIRLFPNHFRAHTSLGGIYLLQGKFAEAERMLRKSLAIQASLEAYSNLAALYILQERPGLAVPLLGKAVKMEGATYKVWGNLGDACLSASGKAAEAPAAYRRALEMATDHLAIHSTDAEACATRAFYLIRLGDRTHALEEIRRVLETEPGNPAVFFWAALVYEEAGDRDRALKCLESALAGGYSKAIVQATSDLKKLRGDPRYAALMQAKDPH